MAELTLNDIAQDAFLEQYLETALWSSIDSEDRPLDDLYGIDDIDQETLQQALEDCNAFREECESLLDASGLDESEQGHLFWLTRNGHGAGFWDGRCSEEIGRKLSDACKPYGTVDLYVGDDGNVHGSN